MNTLQIPQKFIELGIARGLSSTLSEEFYTRKTKKHGWQDLTFTYKHLYADNPNMVSRALNDLWKAWREHGVTGDPAIQNVATVSQNVGDQSFLDRARDNLERLIGSIREVEPPKSSSKKTRKVDIAGDLHVPFHHAPSLKALLSTDAQDLMLMGDVLDMFAASSHRQDLSYVTTQEELAVGRAIIEELAAKYENIYYIAGNHDCFSEDTEILTEAGWVTFERLQKLTGLKVATYNKETGVIEYQEPTSVVWGKYSGDMYHFSRSSLDLLVTPNHRMLARKRMASRPLKDYEAGSLPQTGKYILPLFGGNANTTEVNNDLALITACAWISNYKQDDTIWVKCKSEFINAVVAAAKRLELFVSDALQPGTSLTDDFRWVGISSLPVHINKLSEAAFDKVFGYFVDQIGSRATLSPDTVYNFRSDRVNFDLLQTLLVSNNWSSYVTHTEVTSTGEVKYLKARKNMNVTIDTKEDSGDITKTTYTGYIGCAHVPNDTLVVRRNGKVAITCNSRSTKKFQSLVPGLMPLVIHPLTWLTVGLKNVHRMSITVPNTAPALQFGKDYELDFGGFKYGCLFGHFEKFYGEDAVKKLDDWVGSWGHLLSEGPPKAIFQGHTHRLRFDYTPTGRPLFSTGCLANTQLYQLTDHGKYQPPTQGFIQIQSNDGEELDFTTAKLIYTGNS
jgi:UDP-2,3-diacylglucosamine pyrophosphatase LpxH